MKSGSQRAFRSVLIGILRTSALKNLRQSANAYTVQIAEITGNLVFCVALWLSDCLLLYEWNPHAHIHRAHNGKWIAESNKMREGRRTMKKEQMKMGEKTIETPTLLIKKNIMAWDDTMIQLPNISYVSASDIASLKFPIWAPLLVLAGISLLGISVIPGIVFIIAGGIWLYYWYQENEKRKKCSILTIRMNSGNNLYFKFNNKTFLKRVTHVLTNIFNNGTERQVSINIQDCTITGNAQVLTDGVFG